MATERLHLTQSRTRWAPAATGVLQRVAINAMPVPDQAPGAVHEVLRSTGQALDPAAREVMEQRFGHDFSGVRVHSDSRAAESAQAVNALAYTVGRDVVFGPGQYAPHSGAGRRLLAHELAHTVQQRGAAEPAHGLDLEEDPAAEAEAEAVAAAFDAAGALPVFTRRPTAQRVARQGPARADEFPGFSQGDYVTCGAASLISALMIWDRERKSAAAPNSLLVTACNTVLVYLDDHRSTVVSNMDKFKWKGATGNGKDMYSDIVASVTAVRDAANAPGAKISETQYQDLGADLYFIYKSDTSGGMSRFDIGRLQKSLGIGATTSTRGKSFDELMDQLAGLTPGQIAQVVWYWRGPANAQGMAEFTAHAFLVGRFQRGPWFMSDQGSKPPAELEAPDLPSLKAAIRANTAARNSGIHTGQEPNQTLGGITLITGMAESGVMILGDRKGVETEARNVIMVPGDFIAEVDAGILTSGDRIVAWDFVARTTSLADATKEMNGAGTGSGGVIVENPVGLFHVFKTSLVSDANVTEKSIDEGDSKGGRLARSPKRYYHAWLQLRSAAKTGSFFQVY